MSWWGLGVVTDRLGSVGGPARYYPYGQEREATPEGTEKFATYYRDATGLDYAWNRYYSPTWGRFMQADPSLTPEAMKNPQGWNRYAYVAGDPVSYYDPAGLDACSGNYGVPCFSITVVRFLYFLWLRSFGGGGGGSSDLLVAEAAEPIDLPGSFELEFPALEWRQYIAVRDTIHGLVKSLSTNFTPAILDCMAGIESWWNPKAVNPENGRLGLFQFDEENWNEFQKSLRAEARKPWSQVLDPEASTYVAIVALEARVGIFLKAHPNASVAEAVWTAVHLFGEGVLGMPYAEYVMDCARVIESDFEAAVEVIRKYHRLPRP